MSYIEIDISIVGGLETGQEICVAELADLNFESFSDTDLGLKAYIREADFKEGLLKGLRVFNSDEFAGSAYKINRIEDKNWNEKWESEFDPVEVDDFCLIRAPFHNISGNHSYELIIEPKMSFGTGHHATTWLMISMMSKLSLSNMTVLDMGSGTGVLAILASKMGASEVIGIDIDEWAYRNSIENTKVNNTENCSMFHGDIKLIAEHSYDIILANITKNILMEDLPAYRSACSRDGRLIISGFFEKDIDELIIKAANNGFVIIEKMIRDNWSSLMFTRKD